MNRAQHKHPSALRISPVRERNRTALHRSAAVQPITSVTTLKIDRKQVAMEIGTPLANFRRVCRASRGCNDGAKCGGQKCDTNPILDHRLRIYHEGMQPRRSYRLRHSLPIACAKDFTASPLLGYLQISGFLRCMTGGAVRGGSGIQFFQKSARSSAG